MKKNNSNTQSANTSTADDIPEGFTLKNGIAFGIRQPHCFEIKWHSPKLKNALGPESQNQFGRCLQMGQDDDNVKVILVHGGKNFSSGTDVKILAGWTTIDHGQFVKNATEMIIEDGFNNLVVLNRCKKPIVAVIRGMCWGVTFTFSSMFDFIYMSPDAYLVAPFMQSLQSPEGSSTYTFPKIFGKAVANELLMLDRKITAQEAVDLRFANAIIPELQEQPDWFDISSVPPIIQLCNTDYRTLMNCKALMNAAKDNVGIEKALKVESLALVANWTHPDFVAKFQAYLNKSISTRSKKKPHDDAKL